MKKKMKWWMIPLVVIAVILTVSVLLWPTLKVYLAPKTVLAAALTDTYAMWKQRLENSPILLMADTLDMENGNAIDMKLDTSHDFLGTVQYDMTVQAQWSPRRILAQGQAAAQGTNMDLSVYLDGNFAALSSASILQGNFYGLTYDTFSQDIRSSSLLSFFIDEKTLTEWEAQVGDLQAFMADSWEIPSISEADLSRILMGILTLKADVDREQITVNGSTEDYFVISFETTGKDIASGLNYLQAELPIVLAPDDTVEVDFWLRENAVVKIEVEAGDKALDLYLGMAPYADAAQDALTLHYENAGEFWSITVQTQQDAACYQETVTVSGSQSAEVSYTWDLTTGDLDLQLTREGETDSISANLSKAEGGFRLTTGDFEAVMHLLMGVEDSGNSPCVLTVGPGQAFDTPEYKRFADWSLEDLVTLLGGVGGLFGLKIG